VQSEVQGSASDGEASLLSSDKKGYVRKAVAVKRNVKMHATKQRSGSKSSPIVAKASSKHHNGRSPQSRVKVRKGVTTPQKTAKRNTSWKIAYGKQ
jgi:hypothetical protein